VHSLQEINRFPVYGEKHKRSGTRKRVGRLVDVLFHPDKPEVVGYVVARPDILFLIRRKDVFLARDRVKLLADRAVVDGDKAWGAAAAKRLGFSWDRTVIWRGQPVKSASGKPLGYIRDAVFHESDGRLNGIGLTGGVAADVAIGVRDFPAKFVTGFDGSAIRVTDAALAIDVDGGAAAAAGRGAAVAQDAAGKATVAAVKTAKTAAAYTRSAANVAAKSETAKKAVGFLKSMRDTIVDAAGPPDD
jgi:uncharacterized protein YrrD